MEVVRLREPLDAAIRVFLLCSCYLAWFILLFAQKDSILRVVAWYCFACGMIRLAVALVFWAKGNLVRVCKSIYIYKYIFR